MAEQQDALDAHMFQVPSEMVRLLAGIARGMEAVHAHKIVHLDLKPENVREASRPNESRARWPHHGCSCAESSCAESKLSCKSCGSAADATKNWLQVCIGPANARNPS